MIQIKFFAAVREKVGQAMINLEYGGERNVQDVLNRLQSRGEEWQSLADNNLLCALNQTICSKEMQINDGDEIAFFPPVTGG